MTALEINHAPARSPRLNGLFLRGAHTTTRMMLPLAGKPWNPIFSVGRHTGRTSGRGASSSVC
jgi:hypothetical protein